MKPFLITFAICFVIYLFVMMTIFRFQNPAMSETELFLNALEALRWK